MSNAEVTEIVNRSKSIIEYIMKIFQNHNPAANKRINKKNEHSRHALNFYPILSALK